MTESITLKEMRGDKRLLVCLAHPDDESFGAPPVGTILHYAQAGVAVDYICGTRGEAGTVDPERLAGYDSPAALRTEEMGCAAQILGFRSLHFLNYRDSGMENSPDNGHPAALVQAPVEVVAKKITGLIRCLKPQVVLTFDSTGGYFHPDHIHMHRATTLAFQAAGDPAQFPDQLQNGLTPHQPQKLYYLVFPKGLVKLAVLLLPFFGQNPAALGRNKDVNLKRIAKVRQRVTTKIRTAAYFEAGQRAAACHASQIEGLIKLPKFMRWWLSRSETYSRIAPPFDSGPLETDLFAGV